MKKAASERPFSRPNRRGVQASVVLLRGQTAIIHVKSLAGNFLTTSAGDNLFGAERQKRIEKINNADSD